jgi:malonyl CoA-acyl carrier protein transacylase
MLAMLGGDESAVASLAAELDLLIANDNAPGQVVLSGRREQIDLAADRAPAETGARVRPLAVSGAFHSRQMDPVVEPMREALAATGFAEPAFPVYSCATAAPFENPAEELARNIVRPVHWRETVLAMRDAGIDEFTELGPGKVLTGLVRRIVPRAEPAPEAA